MSGWAVMASQCMGLLWLCLIAEFIRGPVETSTALSASLLSGLEFNFGTSVTTKTTLTSQFDALFYELCLTEVHSFQPTATAY